MAQEHPTVFKIGDYTTLPLYSVPVRLDEPLAPLSKAKASLHYHDPDYEPYCFPPTPEVLNKLGREPEAAILAIKTWQLHCRNFMYFSQFKDDDKRTLIKALSEHTTTLSTLSDTRLQLDPAPLWSEFDLLFSFAAVQEEYRADPERDEKWDDYADQLKALCDRNYESVKQSTFRLLERMQKKVEVQSALWATLPAICPVGLKGKAAGKTLKLFYSYSHADERLRERLQVHLAALKRDEVICEWHDRMILGGSEWDAQIDSHLDDASIILLLISADFIASEYCYGKEMRRAMERHDSGAARVVPVILQPCDWHNAPFAKLQALPKDAKPVTSWSKREEAFANIAHGVRLVAQELLDYEGS